MRRSWIWTSVTGGGLAIAAILAWWGQQPLAPAALVQDAAGLLTDEQRERISEYHDYLLKDHDIDYRVLSELDVDDINQLAVSRFSELSNGMRSRTGRGLLLVIAPGAQLVRLEVSQSLEPVYTDAFVRYIEERQMVPFFSAGRVADGILATTELITARVQEATERAELDPSPNETASAGGGAVARIASAQASQGTDAGVAPGPSPQQTLDAYFEAMDQRNGSPNLAIYTPQTRVMLQSWTVTPAQMDLMVASYRSCVSEGVRTRGGHAVIRYRIADRA